MKDISNDRPNREWIELSRFNASVCANCGAVIAQDELIEIVRCMNFGLNWWHGISSEPERGCAAICIECSDNQSNYKIPCSACGRLMLGYRGSDWSPACSERCLLRLAHIRSPGNRRRAQRRAEARPTTCTVCGGPFKPSRSDAVTCSPACRQKAYRERYREGVTVVEGGTN